MKEQSAKTFRTQVGQLSKENYSQMLTLRKNILKMAQKIKSVKVLEINNKPSPKEVGGQK